MVFNVLTATAKTFGVESEGPQFPTGSGNFAYKVMLGLIHKTFVKGNKIGSKEIIRWISETPEMREFFSFIEAGNSKITLK